MPSKVQTSNAAKMIASTLGTPAENGYVFNDDRVSIIFSEDQGIVNLYLISSTKKIKVMECGNQGLFKCFRKGKWEKYIHKILLPKAEAYLDQAKIEFFAPVDDAELFPEFPNPPIEAYPL